MPRRNAWASSLCSIALGCAGGAALAQGAAPCFDEFVQEVEVDDGGGMLRDVRPCNTGELGGPPAFPRSTVKIRIEYSGGDHYTEQVKRSWDLVPDGAGCVNAVLRVDRLVHLREGGRNQSARELQGRVQRSRDGGDDLGSLFLYGAGAKSPPPGANAPNTRIESTTWGLDCVRYQPPALPGMPPGTVCWALVAPRCAAGLWLAPIELRTPLSPSHSATHRTTALRTGARGQEVDRGRWVLP
jgi:hypothetical protein